MFVSKAFVIAAFCLAATLGSTPFYECNGGYIPPTELRVKGCTEDPCTFQFGEDIEFEMDFTAGADTDNLRPMAWLKLMGTNIPQPILNQPDACKSLKKGECPLKYGEKATYALKMPFLTMRRPEAPYGMKFLLVDDRDIIHTCFSLKFTN